MSTFYEFLLLETGDYLLTEASGRLIINEFTYYPNYGNCVFMPFRDKRAIMELRDKRTDVLYRDRRDFEIFKDKREDVKRRDKREVVKPD